MSLAWMTVDRREDWPHVKPNLRSRITIARWYMLAAWKWAIRFVTGLILGLALLNLIQARAEQEIVQDFTAAPASVEDSGLLLSFGDGRPAPGPEERAWTQEAEHLRPA